ncbi:peptidylprolyl isomerase [Vibrio campbellii]|uniref:DUF1481 domain-containing protein n=1 Tax=Vibrio campbellii TaxID=680 RepID=A0ABY5IFH7_9VIBR|nr:DUF1481 domain-containing protein [Vibrio campbellii]APX04820.1 peptidylprolyl isomerase [Vibrio campbellii]ARR04947.1 peptidyl-prolyl cis-trans isomerase [Vibrio campbellii]UTZ32402.1 DUF1481 domain-containing protein [Vibrio campbellii]
MKKHLLTSLLLSSLALVGCSSVETPNLDQFTNFSGGKIMGDATSLYWMTERLTRVSTAADYVTMGDYGSYQSDYRWDDGELRELIRKGKQLDAKQGLVPFQIHIRFNKDGDAVYQQYRVNGKVLPLQRDQLERYKQEANDVVTSIKKQSRDGQSLIQGYWDGETFETCKGREFTTLEFNQTLPKFVIDRLASVDSYIAFIGKESRNAATVDELLMLNDDDFDCVPRPKLISE